MQGGEHRAIERPARAAKLMHACARTVASLRRLMNSTLLGSSSARSGLGARVEIGLRTQPTAPTAPHLGATSAPRFSLGTTLTRGLYGMGWQAGPVRP